MKNISRSISTFVVLAVWAACVFAQAPVPSREVAQTPSVSPPPPPIPAALPIVDPSKELSGMALVEALRKGGFVLYMRHTETGVVTEKCEQSNLSAIGEEHARNVGGALRDLKIPIGAVRSSFACRCADAARMLGLGTVEPTADLNPVAPQPSFDLGAARSKRLNELPPAGTNTVLVSHLHGSQKKEEWLHLQMGEIIVFRPDINARAVPVARVALAGWLALKNVQASDSVAR